MKPWVSLFVLVTIPAAGLGYPDDPAAHLNFLITEPSYSGCGDPDYAWIDAADCVDLGSAPLAGEAFVWVVASHAGGFPDGIGAVQFGIEHSSGVISWTACTGGSEIPGDGWPASGSGDAITWRYGCYRPSGENAKVGFFRVADGASGSMAIIPDPRPERALYVDCGERTQGLCGPNLDSADLSLGTTPNCEVLAPAVPTDCRATDDACALTVSWQHDGIDATGFQIWRDGSDIAEADALAREYVDTMAVLGEYHDYAVRSLGACGPSDLSNSDRGHIPIPDFAWSCVASNDDCDVVRVTWEDGSSDELGFKVIRDDTLLAVVGPDTTSYVDSTTVLGWNYEYRIVAFGECGDAESSNGDDGSRKLPPAAPRHCAATEDLCHRVLITWRDYGAETAFKVLRDADSVGSVPSGVTEFVDSTGVPGQSYLYSVVSMNECGDSEPSNADVGIASTAPPAAASACTASQDLCAFVRLSWQDNSDEETAFKILRDGVVIDVVESDVHQADDSTATPGAVYAYRIVAANDCGDAAPSEPADGRAGSEPPLAATDCSATDTLCGRVRVTWSDRSADESGFRVLRDGSEIGVTAPNATEFDDTTGTPDVTYAYTAIATSACGDAEPSNADPGTRLEPLFPQAPSLVGPADGVTCAVEPVTFSWERVPDAVFYLLEVGSDCGAHEWVHVTTPDTAYTPDLPGGLTLHWRVQAKNICEEWGDPSECRGLSVSPDLGPPAWFQAEPSYIEEHLWAFSWAPVPQAEHYVLGIGSSVCYGQPSDDAVFLAVTGTDTLVDMTPWWADYDAPRFETMVAGFACGETGEASTCLQFQPIPVLLEYFEARSADRAIVLEWRTSREWGMRGFNLARSEDAGAGFVRVNPELIPGGRGAYRYEDREIEGNASYTYRLSEIEDDGREVILGEATVTSTPAAFALRQNVPNPFNPRTWIVFELPASENVTLGVYDTAGRRIRRLAEASFVAGIHRVPWDGRDDAGRLVASGTYFARLEAGTFESIRRLVLLK
jgi:hypothetical protein